MALKAEEDSDQPGAMKHRQAARVHRTAERFHTIAGVGGGDEEEPEQEGEEDMARNRRYQDVLESPTSVFFNYHGVDDGPGGLTLNGSYRGDALPHWGVIGDVSPALARHVRNQQGDLTANARGPDVYVGDNAILLGDDPLETPTLNFEAPSRSGTGDADFYAAQRQSRQRSASRDGTFGIGRGSNTGRDPAHYAEVDDWPKQISDKSTPPLGRGRGEQYDLPTDEDESDEEDGTDRDQPDLDEDDNISPYEPRYDGRQTAKISRRSSRGFAGAEYRRERELSDADYGQDADADDVLDTNAGLPSYAEVSAKDASPAWLAFLAGR
jgi:hypothetical protein